jgi:hypothetical protein
MPMRTELAFSYDKNVRPISARCTRCNAEMPPPGRDLALPADVVMWFSQQFLEHKRLNHPDPEQNCDPDATT